MTHSSTPAGWTRKMAPILIFVLSAAVRVHGQQPHDSSLSEWPGWRGPKRDGKSPDSGLLREWPDGGPRLLWKVDDIGKGYSSVSVSEGVIYTSGDVSGRLFIFAFDMNGEPRWKADHDKACTRNPPGSRATPTIDAGNLYLLSGNGLVGCYDASNGKPKWNRAFSEFGGSPPDGGCAESVLIYKDLAIVTPGGAKCIVGLNKASGETAWTTQGYDAEAQYSSCIVFTYQRVPMIVTGTRGGLVCVSPGDGRVLWSNPWCAGNTFNCTTPVYSDGYVFWSNGSRIKGGICLKLDVAGSKVTAEEAWTTKELSSFHGGYIVHNGYIYGNHGNGWVCLDLRTGQKKAQSRGVGRGSMCFANGMLYLFSERGGSAGLMTCSPEGLEMKGSFSVQGSGPSFAHPVVVGGRLYLRYDSNLYCYQVRAE